MKQNKFPITEKEVIEFENNHKHNYKEPEKWSTIDEIINNNPKKQLKLYGVVKSFYCIDYEKSNGKVCKCNNQCTGCWQVEKQK